MKPNHISSNDSDKHIEIKKEQITLHTHEAFSYKYIHFSVPEDAAKVGITLSYERRDGYPKVFFSFFDPNQYRGSHFNKKQNGIGNCDFWVSRSHSSAGCIPGEIPAGEWQLLLDIRELEKESVITMKIYCEKSAHEETQAPAAFSDTRVVKAQTGWYQGELHTHSTESDGTLEVDKLIQLGFEKGLDFLAISDHFTTSQWWRMGKSAVPNMILLNSMELTAIKGHANLHGIKQQVDTFIDRDDWDINDAADETHKQGGLFCVNHALLSGTLGWQIFDIDWHKVDLMEIYHSMVGPNNSPTLSLWDGLLREGYRIIGVAGTDVHNPERDVAEIGETVTRVFAEELSAEGILNGLKAGNVCISKGPALDFWIENSHGEKAVTGEEIASFGNPITLSMQIKSRTPLRVMLIRDGFFLHSTLFEPGKQNSDVISYVDPLPGKGFYRIELHTIKDDPRYYEAEWRDFETIQGLSNPIWVN